MSVWLRVLYIVSILVPLSFITTEINAGPAKSRGLSHLFDIKTANATGLVLPTDVEVDGSRVVIVDSGNNRIVVLNRDGREILTFGRQGKGKGQRDAEQAHPTRGAGGICIGESQRTGQHVVFVDDGVVERNVESRGVDVGQNVFVPGQRRAVAAQNGGAVHVDVDARDDGAAGSSAGGDSRRSGGTLNLFRSGQSRPLHRRRV